LREEDALLPDCGANPLVTPRSAKRVRAWNIIMVEESLFANGMNEGMKKRGDLTTVE
jgi:hypothetical protein